MRVFSVKNDKTYTKEYYNLIYSTFFAETKDGAIRQAREKLEAGNLFGNFDLEEFGDNEYHCIDGVMCGKLEPLKACSYSLGGGGTVYRCLNCNEEIDNSQGELFCNEDETKTNQ